MFGLFKKKGPSVKITDKIWMSEDAKFASILLEARTNKATIFICWFEETLRRLELLDWQKRAPALLLAREATARHIKGQTPVFIEHYPLQEKENALFEKLGLQQVTVWSALDEPLFSHFGGDKIIGMMKQLGMKDDASIEHNMISKAIRSAQEKIAGKVTLEQSARSQKDWMEKNLAS